jgi:Domain of unknown function (DUF4157)
MAGPLHEHDHDRDDGSHERVPAQAEAAPLERLASGVGNQAFASLARDGAGIMPNGRAHPDVEMAIARSRGRGSALDEGVRGRIAPALGDDLGDVRVHDDDHADTLARSVQARAFATGSDVFFAKGEYQPNTSSGDKLLAHELSHVVQQRGAPTSGPMMVSQPGDAMEVEADRTAHEISD